MQNGDAWNSSGISTVYSGYDGLERPSAYDLAAVEAYNNAASDNVLNNFDSSTLDPERLYTVNMYFKGSPYQEEAFNNGTKGRTGTHTGYLQNQDGQWYVVHNIHGRVHIDPFSSIQGGGRGWGVTGIYAPRKDNLWNRSVTKLGFAGGGLITQIDGIEIPNYGYLDYGQDIVTQNNRDLSPLESGVILDKAHDYIRQKRAEAHISGLVGKQPESKSLPPIVMDILQNDVMGRAKAAYKAEGIPMWRETQLSDAPNNWFYRSYPRKQYVAAGKSGVTGFTTAINNHFISLNESAINPFIRVLPHEGRHLFQQNGLKLTPKQKEILNSAYDDGFLSLPFYSWPINHMQMKHERETTNLDARNSLLTTLGKQSLIGKGPDLQNPVIQKASWNQVLDAVSKANGYGKQYIEHLKKQYKNDPQKLREHAERFRQAMMYVAMISNTAPALSRQEQATFAAYGGFVPQEPWLISLYNNVNKQPYS